MFGHGPFVAQRRQHQSRAEWALVSVSSVVKVFDEMMNSVSAGVEIARGLDDVGAVDVRHEAKRHVAVGCNAAAPRRP